MFVIIKYKTLNTGLLKTLNQKSKLFEEKVILWKIFLRLRYGVIWKVFETKAAKVLAAFLLPLKICWRKVIWGIACIKVQITIHHWEEVHHWGRPSLVKEGKRNQECGRNSCTGAAYCLLPLSFPYWHSSIGPVEKWHRTHSGWVSHQN